MPKQKRLAVCCGLNALIGAAASGTGEMVHSCIFIARGTSEHVRPSRALIGRHAMRVSSIAREYKLKIARRLEPIGRPVCYGFVSVFYLAVS